MTEVQLGNHHFRVPDEYMVTDGLAFLPKSESESLYIALDPQLPEKDQVLVIVGTIRKFCNFNNPPVIDRVPRACAVAKGQAPQPKIGQLTKVVRSRGATVNRYDYKGEDGGVAVSCTGEPGQSGSCSATFAWRDLVWDATFDEQWVPRLDELRAEVARRLDEWSADA